MTTTSADEVDAAVDRFDAAFGSQDIDAVMAAMTHDCIFEGTAPPDGSRSVGQDAVREAFASFFASTPDARFETEARFRSGDRVVVQWVFHWGGTESGHVRGVDLFRIRDGLVAEKVSYVKG
jgi:ketosteroid isomerase-like protein